MKQIALLMAAVFFLGVSCFAQNESKFKSLKDNIAKSDAATQDAKKSINPKTWMDRGKLFQDAYNANVGYLRFGMPTTEAPLYFKEPKQALTVEEAGEAKEIYEYSQIKLHFAGGLLKSWEETETVVNNPLADAVSAYQKAASLDEKGKNAKKIGEAYKAIAIDLENKFFNEIALVKYKDAYNTALQRIDVSKLTGVADTSYYFYAGYAAYAQSEIDSSMWQQTVDNLEKALSLGYKEIGDSKGQIYDILYIAYIKIGDPEKALKSAQTGFEKYPDYERLMYDLINYYLSRQENEQALNYLDRAVAKDPQNANLLFAKGKVLDELGEREKSLAAYDEAIAANPKYFEPYFNKAVVYYNNAIKLMDDANAEKTTAGFEAKKDIADEEFQRAVPLLEKALEINPDEAATMETLRILYYRLKTKYPEYEAKYEDFSKKLGK
ncbi:MAG: tetratricopeptide repeat protein [Bacteroidales bacterium]|jgi:tetratricopeptide (TPR) repeat protein|nr:tetratricopeptide repeat protein [Bacteroidales bacterium]